MGEYKDSVEGLVKKVKRKQLRLPAMQRRYVWRATRVRDLLDSLYRGYPSGTILVWANRDPVPVREMAVKQDKASGGQYELLLDGQQRLTSLAAILTGEPLYVRGRKRPLDILFNLEHPDKVEFAMDVDDDGEDVDDDEEADDPVKLADEEDADLDEDEMSARLRKLTFVVASKRLKQQPNWVSVTDVLISDAQDADIMERLGVHSMRDPRYKKFASRLQQLRSIKDYEYNVHVLDEKLSYEEVTDIFVRVNSLGAKLRSSDLAMAQITAKWRDALTHFDAYADRCTEAKFPVEHGILVKNLVSQITGQSKFNGIGTIKEEVFKSHWKPSIDSFDRAIDFLKNNVGIDHPAMLSSPFLLITLACLFRKKERISPKEERTLRHWVVVANAKGRYSRGASESLLNQDLVSITSGPDLGQLLNSLAVQFGRLDIQPVDLLGRNQRSGLFRTMFLVFRSKGAKDWFTQGTISVSQQSKKHQLQFHHIFPKARLRAMGLKPALVNDICNFAFIGGHTNRKLLTTPPAQYIPKLLEEHGPAAFKLQSIPTESRFLPLENYEKFLDERRKRVAAALNDYLEDIRKG
jgi:hypothetical protein